MSNYIWYGGLGYLRLYGRNLVKDYCLLSYFLSLSLLLSVCLALSFAMIS